MFLRHDLDELLACDKSPAVSIYLPAHPAGREVRQNAIRLRNLLATAARRLGTEHRPPDIAALLEPARKLLDDEEFWRHQEHGLALFLAPGFERIHKLPIEVPEEVSIGSHFCIRPLLGFSDPAGWFWVLTVSAGRTRLYQGSRWTFEEARPANVPQGVAEVLNESTYQETHQASAVGRPPHGSTGLAKAQAYEAPEELRKAQLLEYLRRVAGAIEPIVKHDPAPVILAAAPEIQGNFRELAHWKELLPEGLLENPDALAEAELHAKAWELYAPREEQTRADALGRLQGLLGTGGKATTKPEEIVKAAHYGRIDRLFLAESEPLWGHFAVQQDRVVAHGNPVEGDDDLLDYAALMTLRQGGNVTLVEREQLPPSGPAAAILRY